MTGAKRKILCSSPVHRAFFLLLTAHVRNMVGSLPIPRNQETFKLPTKGETIKLRCDDLQSYTILDKLGKGVVGTVFSAIRSDGLKVQQFFWCLLDFVLARLWLYLQKSNFSALERAPTAGNKTGNAAFS